MSVQRTHCAQERLSGSSVPLFPLLKQLHSRLTADFCSVRIVPVFTSVSKTSMNQVKVPRLLGFDDIPFTFIMSLLKFLQRPSLLA